MRGRRSKDLLLLCGVFDVEVKANKDAYTIGEYVKLGIVLESHGSPYMIDFKLDVEHADEEWNYMEVTGNRFPADYTWKGEIPIAIPKSKLMPPGDYEFFVRIEDSYTGQLLSDSTFNIYIWVKYGFIPKVNVNQGNILRIISAGVNYFLLKSIYANRGILGVPYQCQFGITGNLPKGGFPNPLLFQCRALF